MWWRQSTEESQGRKRLWSQVWRESRTTKPIELPCLSDRFQPKSNKLKPKTEHFVQVTRLMGKQVIARFFRVKTMLDQNVKTFRSGDNGTNSICGPPLVAPDGCPLVWGMEGHDNAWIPLSESGEIRWVTVRAGHGKVSGRPWVLVPKLPKGFSLVELCFGQSVLRLKNFERFPNQDLPNKS